MDPKKPSKEYRDEWDRLFPLFQRSAKFYADRLHRNGCRIEPEELAQQALMRLWELLPRFDATRASMKTWAFNKINQLIIDHARTEIDTRRGGTGAARKKRKIVVFQMKTHDRSDNGAPQDLHDPPDRRRDAIKEREEFDEIVHRSQLKPAEREWVMLRFFDGLTVEECAERIGRSESTGLKHFHNAYKKIRRYLERRRHEG